MIGSTGRATAEITELTGMMLVNSEEYSGKTSKEFIQKGTSMREPDACGLTLLVEKT